MPPQSIAKISTLINTLLNFVSGKNQHPQNANAQKSGKNTIKIIKNIGKSMTNIILSPKTYKNNIEIVKILIKY